MPDERSQPALRILVVEDHDDSAYVTRRYLIFLGHDVTLAADVAAAIKATETQRFDVLLCDYQLPNGTGCDVLDRLRAHGFVRTVAMTAHGEDMVKTCTNGGFDRCLLKPVEVDQFHAILQGLRPRGAASEG